MKVCKLISALVLPIALNGCLAGQGFNLQNSTASRAANNQAEQNLYRPVNYVNAATRGPQVIVLPGKIKSNNSSFRQKVTSNNIADFAELELGNANFRVLERSDLGPLLNELNLAINLGDPRSLKKFKRGKFKTTKYFIKMDILKAEKAATASTGFDGRAIGNIAGNLFGNARHGNIANTLGSSVQTQDSAGVWVVGMRYKLLSAETTEQIATGYFEEKMEVGAKSVGFLGGSQSQTGGTTLDTIVQRLVQKAVSDIDRRGK